MTRGEWGIRWRWWPLLVLVFFGLVYVQSLAFVYGEGDDLASIASITLTDVTRKLPNPTAPITL